MFINVDGVSGGEVEGFEYTNKRGCSEKVIFTTETYITIKDSNNQTASIYNEDIPKLIAALQAANKMRKQ